MGSNDISAFLDFLRNCKETYHINRAVQRDKEGLTQDILHEIELDSPSYHEMAKLSKALQAARRERRTAKDICEVLEPVVSYVESNQDTIHALEKLLGDVRKIERKHENRFYTPKVNRPETA